MRLMDRRLFWAFAVSMMSWQALHPLPAWGHSYLFEPVAPVDTDFSKSSPERREDSGNYLFFSWPVSQHKIVRGFSLPPKPWMSGHRGVDLASHPKEQVRAAASGQVHFAGLVAGKPVISVQHNNGEFTSYEPVQALVKRGQSVQRGQVLGVVAKGHKGCPQLGCVHFGLRDAQKNYLNPEPRLRVWKSAQLLPW